MCVLIFSTTFAWNISHSEKNWPRNDQKCISVFVQSACRYSGQVLMKLEFSRHVRKIIKYQISWKSVQWELSCSMQTDGHDEANNRFSQFCNAPKSWTRQKKQPVSIHTDISHRKHVPSFGSEFTPRSTMRLQKLTVARLVERFAALYGTGCLLKCLHILALTFTRPISTQSIPKKRITLPHITRSTKCSLSSIHSHIHMPHVSAIQLFNIQHSMDRL
jgi:hypothetical protein